MANLSEILVHNSSRYGAPMGRVPADTKDPDEKLSLRRVRINSQGYDSGGAYWGITTKTGPGYLYVAFSDTFNTYVRGWTRDEAKAAVRGMFPQATFKR